MGGNVSIHADTIAHLEKTRAEQAAKFLELGLADHIASQLQPRLSAAARVFAIADCAPITGPISGAPRGDHEDAAVTTKEGAPIQASYETCIDRVFNKDAWAFPLVIVRVASAADIAAVIDFARGVKVPLSIAAGAHSAKSFVTGTVTIDLYNMRKCTYDAATQLVHCEAGALIAHLDAALATHKRFTPIGTNPYTGIAGLTLAGGMGWFSPLAGMTCDNLVELEVVLASGQIIVARDDNEHAALLAACRGGGGHFGVVSKLTYRTHALPNDGKIWHGSFVPMCPTTGQKKGTIKNWVTAVESWRASNADTDRFTMMVLPCGAPVIPTAWAYYGASVAADSIKAACPELHTTTKNLGGLFLAQKEWKQVDFYSVIQQSLVEHQAPGFYYQAFLQLDSMNDAVQEKILHFTSSDIPNKLSALLIFPFLGRALTGVDGVATALTPRPGYWILVEAKWAPESGSEGRQAVVGWVERLREAFKALAKSPEIGLNTAHAFSDTLEDRSAADPLRSSKLAQLLATKSTYDPEDVFVNNRRLK